MSELVLEGPFQNRQTALKRDAHTGEKKKQAGLVLVIILLVVILKQGFKFRDKRGALPPNNGAIISGKPRV